jgi:hypothetical protein
MKKLKKNEKTEKLTYEEHKKIDQFLRHFHDEGQEVFRLLRKAFKDKDEPVIRMAKAVNLLSCLHQYCETKSCFDRPIGIKLDSDEFNKWQMLYYHIGSWTTYGWEK